MIPNTDSLVFKNFIRKMNKQKRTYNIRHQRINIEKLFKQNNIELIRKSGRNLWLKDYCPYGKMGTKKGFLVNLKTNLERWADI